MKNLKYFVLCFVAGAILGYFLLPKTPDIEIVKETLAVTKKVDRVINKDRIIERKIYVSTDGTAVTLEREVIKDRIVEKEVEKVVEKRTEKLINHSGSVFILWDFPDLKIYPSVIGASFLVINPISIVAQFEIKVQKVKIGIEFDF